MRVTFDEWVFDTDCHQLEKNGVTFHLQPKAFQLLQYLIEAAPAAISHTHLYDLLWGETHVVEANLRNLVADIRAALGDGNRDGRYIRTVHGFGYRFVAQLKIDAHPYRSPFLLESDEGRFWLKHGPNLVGRDPSAEVHLESPDVARVHAAIIVCGDEIIIEPRTAEHPTLVGSQPVDAAASLRVGDVLRFGPVSLTLRMRADTVRRGEDQPGAPGVIGSQPQG